MNYIRGRCPCQEEPSASVRTVNLLSGREFRNFWVKVSSDRHKTSVQVGLGESDSPFHEWRDPRPLSPMFLSFRSAAPATWRYGFQNEHYDNGVSIDRRQSVVTSTGFGQYFPLSEYVSHSEDGITLYFTARTSRELQLQPELRLAHVPFSGQELPFTNYETLVQSAPTSSSVFLPSPAKIDSVATVFSQPQIQAAQLSNRNISPSSNYGSSSIASTSSSSSSSSNTNSGDRLHQRHETDRGEAYDQK
ncbi:unnamed protein product [Trichogramma brassicae]|uniref:Farnesoic acid O-methyl transferase domain-containing protein n=1 Tax=Trichogramma brassicae TaxID=86971 RepID=A0A6H5I851_9HYME|nr:unnamed protein product [Trichogramma brassicae]